VRATLQAVYPQVAVIPGDSNLFIAGSAAAQLALSPDALVRTLGERQLATSLITSEHLAYRLAAEPREWLAAQLGDAATVPANDDLFPHLLYSTLAYRALGNSPGVARILTGVRQLQPYQFAVLAALLLMAAAVAVRGRRVPAVAVAVAGSGMAAMMGELLLMYAFQVHFGSLYYLVGLFMGLFMTGIAMGSRLASSRAVQRVGEWRLLCLIEGSFIALFLLIAWFLQLFGQGGHGWLRLLLVIIFLVLLGLITGLTYPLASRCHHLQHGVPPGHRDGAGLVPGAGIMYAADLAGGCIGGVGGALLLFPALGLTGTCLFLALCKLGTLTILLGGRR
jgi:spermidine synthase